MRGEIAQRRENETQDQFVFFLQLHLLVEIEIRCCRVDALVQLTGERHEQWLEYREQCLNDQVREHEHRPDDGESFFHDVSPPFFVWIWDYCAVSERWCVLDWDVALLRTTRGNAKSPCRLIATWGYANRNWAPNCESARSSSRGVLG